MASTVDGVERSASPPDGPPVLVGQRLGSYVLGEVIGQGAMGTVYRATHHSLGHMVAVKVIQSGVVGDSAVAHERFFREARAAARLDHEGIVRVIDFAREPAVGSYIVMELVRGQSLDALVGQTPPLKAGELAAIGASIAESIQVAHEGGVIHRDLKPANVLVINRGGQLRVKVADFGVAKLFDAPDNVRTKTGKLVGTPLYMSPEQWRGEQVDTRSDIYSLGALLYELASGSLPHTGSAYEIAYRVATEPPAPLAAARPELPADLIAVIERCLQKSPAARYPTMTDVKLALDEIAERELPPRSLRSLPPMSDRSPPGRLPVHHAHLPRWVSLAVVATALLALWALVLASQAAPSASVVAASAAPQSPLTVSAAPPVAPSMVVVMVEAPAVAAVAPSAARPSQLAPVVRPPRAPASSAPAPPRSRPRPAEPDEELYGK